MSTVAVEKHNASLSTRHFVIFGAYFSIAWLAVVIFRPNPCDFASYFAAGKLALTQPHSLYSLEAQATLQHSLGNSHFMPWLHPAPESLLFVPLTFLGYAAAFNLWAAISLGMLAAVLWLLRREILALDALKHYALIALAYTPLSGGLINGQDHTLFLLLWVAAYRNLQEKRYFTAGILAGLALIRYQFTLPMLLFFLLKRQRRFLSGAAITAIALAIASRIMVGPDLIPSYLRSLKFLAQSHDAVTVTSMPTVRGFLGYFHLPHANAVSAIASVIVLAFGLWAAGKLSDPVALLSFAIVVSLLVDYHAFLYELPVILIPLMPILRRYPRAVILPWSFFGLYFAKNVTGLNTFALAAPLLLAFAFWMLRTSVDTRPRCEVG